MASPTETRAPVASTVRKALRRSALPIGAFLVAASCLAFAARRFHDEQVATVRANAANELLAVTDLKVEQMVTYNRERLANAASLRLNVLVARGIEDLLRGDLSRTERGALMDWVSSLATQHRYSRVTLARADGTILAQSPLSTRTHLGAETMPAAQRAFESRSPTVWRGDADHTTMFDIFVPLFRPAGGEPLALVVLEADVAGTMAAATYWPVPRRTAAVWFLVDCPEHGRPEISTSRQRGRHVEAYAVGDETVRALLQRPGVVQTVSEGERRVLAVVAAVPATPWTLVAQIDEDEVLELARARSLATTLAASLMICLLAAATALWVRRASRSARRREAALRSELDGVRQQFVVVSAAFRGSGMGSALLDRDAHILEANPALAELLGLSPEDVVGRSLIGFSCADDQPRATVLFGELLAGERDHYRDERKFVRPDGGIAHVVLRVSAIRDGDQLQVALALVEDVTELKSLQAQLTHADRMASVGTLAAGVAHEINNPLAFVLANVGYAEEELARPAHDAAEVRKALAEAHEGARRVRQIVLDLKTFAREDERAARATDVAEAIRFALSLVHNELRHRARLELDVGDLPPIQGAEHRVGQVLVNLLVNAVHALPPDRTENVITITARGTDDGHVDIAVGDNGAGIAPDVLPRIFDPFFTTKPVGSGTGLGLAICHGIVTQLGGRMTVESEVGAGSTFHVTLPAALEPANDPAVPGPAAALPVNARVLVVDDEPLVASSVARVLGHRCAVEAVSHARGALERLAASRFDVILCDLMMPNFSGAEFYRVLSATSPALAARTVFLTGGAFTPDAEAFLERERPPVLAKPFEPDQLRLAVAAALGACPADAAA